MEHHEITCLFYYLYYLVLQIFLKVHLNYSILLEKLSKFGLSVAQLDFFFISSEQADVEYRDYRSFDVLATSSVPQGSVLGALMFIVFISCLYDEQDSKF